MINPVISENEGRPTQDHLNAHVQAELKEYDKLQGTRSFKLTMCWEGTDAYSTISFNTTKLGIENKINFITFGLESKLLTSFIIA